MKLLIKQLIPQQVINYFWHLPKALFANIKYGFPSRNLTVIGVTGTDGKTTTTNMIYQILKTAGRKVSMVSTINASVGGKEIDTGFHVTSPDPMLVQKLLRQSADLGDEFAILEVTSHALDQFRFWGIKFNIGVITNITHEHLDYHKSRENYFIAKSKLIRNAKVAILNRDEKHFKKLYDQARGKVVTFGTNTGADFNLKNFPLRLKIPGDFNLLNALAAAAVAQNLGIDKKAIKTTLEKFTGLTGRMEKVPNKKGINIFIDFAHTPNALKEALEALRGEYKSGKLIAVFGSAGERDEQKRPLMGEVSTKISDITIITAEDPRGKIDEINKQILKGCEKGGGVLGKNVFIETDRQKAIKLAMKLARKEDTIGIFGKGHEQSMNLDGKHEIAWSDLEAVNTALGNLYG